MTMFVPSVGDARTSDEDRLWAVAAVPVPVLYEAAQAAIASGAWAEACELLGEIVWLEPGFGHARQLLAQARRAHARATRPKPTVNPWPVVISAAALVLVPVATGLATGFGTGQSAQVAVEPASVTVVSVPTAMPTVVPPPPVVVPAAPTSVAGVVPTPTVRAANPTVLPLVAPTAAPTRLPEPAVGQTALEPTRVPRQTAAEPTRLPARIVAEPTRLPALIAAEPTRLPARIVAEPTRVPAPTVAEPTTVEPTRVLEPTVAEPSPVEPTRVPAPTVAEQSAADMGMQPTPVSLSERMPTGAVSESVSATPVPPAMPEEVVIRQSPAKQDVTR